MVNDIPRVRGMIEHHQVSEQKTMGWTLIIILAIEDSKMKTLSLRRYWSLAKRWQ